MRGCSAVSTLSRKLPSAPSPLNPQIIGAVQRLTVEFWPAIPVIAVMSAGATDGSFLRNAGIPTCGHSGLGSDAMDNRACGRDEHILVKSFVEGQQVSVPLGEGAGGCDGCECTVVKCMHRMHSK